MEKLWIIIKREYLTRVKKRSFILATLLTPLAFAIFFVLIGFIVSYEDGDERKIAVMDPGNILGESGLASNKDGSMHFVKSTKSLNELKREVEEGSYSAVLLLPEIADLYSKKETVYYYTDAQTGLDVTESIKRKVRKSVEAYKISKMEVDVRQLEAIKPEIILDPEPITQSAQNNSSMSGVIAAAIGGMMGLIMYLTVFIYGMMVMRSVMEEKMSRIVEVMISSVKPFQLMMGKIIGVGAVGLTQVGIWAILIPLLSLLVNLIFGFSSMDMQAGSGMPGGMDMGEMQIDPEDAQLMAMQAWNELSNLNWWMILPLFIFYFLGGYFLYASLFAAVGSAMSDDLGEGQALTIPITIPVILAFYIMAVAVRSPDSNLAIWSSIFPLFSPIVMPARLAFSPPLWQILLSVAVLIASSIFFVWLSAKIYRVGILMYGKKVSLREIGKWMFSKD